MAEKELRRMSREELVEIIYAMQQSQHQLEQQNEELRTRLDDRTLKWEQAGSLAEAALSLNHVFEDAQAAADQYLASLKAGGPTPARRRTSLPPRHSGTLISCWRMSGARPTTL